MFEARNLSLSVGTKDLLVNTSFRIGDKDRVGLVGLNGTGKSTLLKIISDYATNHTYNITGDVLKSASTTLGYLPQEISFEDDLEKSALQYTLEANKTLFKLSQSISKMETQLADPSYDHESDEYHQLIHDFSEATHDFERMGGFRIQSESEKVLSGLGFSEQDFHKKLRAFSGGWQMRLLLAKLLIQNPTLLLLDEPTNHLDIDSLRWLENYLLGYEHGYVIVSHDRFFLDKLTTKTFEIGFKQINEYKGNFSYYESAKVERYELSVAKYKNDLKKIQHLESFVERFRYKATKARQAQSRLRELQKLQADLEAPEEDLSQISFRFPKALPSGKVVLTLEGISKAYPLPTGGKKTVLKNIDLEVMRGDRIAIVGSNGAGKTTLCKILSGQTEFEGKFILGHNVELSYYSQHQTENLASDKTILNEMLDSAPDSDARKKVRDILGCFLFSGDSVEKLISVLSGGEKSRVALAKILLLSSNLLILDEPTNHLDMRSKDMLIEALENYNGTLIIVSHDRYFLDSLVDKVIEIKDGMLKLYQEPYADYLVKKERSLLEEATQSNIVDQKKQEPKPSNPIKSTQNKQQEKKLATLEKKILDLETQKEDLEKKMGVSDFYESQDKAQKTINLYQNISAELEQLYKKWEAMVS